MFEIRCLYVVARLPEARYPNNPKQGDSRSVG